MKQKCLIALIAILIFTNIICQAGSLSADNIANQEIYQNAKVYFLLGKYQNAADEFKKISGYADSSSWRYYCLGLADIETANEMEKAGYLNEAVGRIDNAADYFDPLAVIGFENSDALKKYCSARKYQAKGLTQTALDLYASLFGVLDSADRYWELTHPNPTNLIPTQAPVEIIRPRLARIPAHVEKSIYTYLGPGSNYITQNFAAVNASSKLWVCAREGDYNLIEVETSSGTFRAWAPWLRIKPDSGIKEPMIGGTRRETQVSQDTEAMTGPGEHYMKSGFIIKKGTKVIAYEDEERYTMIQCNDPLTDRLVRVWIPSDSLI